ncbi:DNRLRE domain-containing protein [Conexibacter stalactiti]|uniref:DNRLRE domain-containing protein n=1 Tax=Conexibacter stalactiti TaxID=1940611 RepID=A0ABU4HKI3_9ACTN|nr:DNRLRE domain-containing protein [Conexibacter stalactiti]MDW5593822.1 DNRLRE domain-containing protein [Conexibacter stalactiti]MEC5034464.1 DNRLRE domain-containing protein [Conexibacter stalactiti]
MSTIAFAVVGLSLCGAAPSVAKLPLETAKPQLRTAPPNLAGDEVVSLRTASSRTYRTSRGTLVTRVTATAPGTASPGAAALSALSSGPAVDCYIVSGAGANDPHCAEGVLKVGSDSASEYRSLLRFDLSSIPAQSQFVDATMGLSAASCSTLTPPTALVVQRVTTGWAESASQGPSWNSADVVASSPWRTPGGDFEGIAIPRSTAGSSSCFESWFFPARLAQAWAEGAPNLGVIVRAASPTGREVLQFGSSRSTDPTRRPILDVEYRPRTGDLEPYTYDRRELTERTTLSVNVANGNLLVQERDVEFFDTDVDYPIDRTYNNLAHQLDQLGTTDLGAGWNQSFDRRVTLPATFGASRTTVSGPTGELFAYTYDGDSTFDQIGDIRPQLLYGVDYLRLFDPETNTTVEFNPANYSVRGLVDARDNAISFTKTSSGPITAISDPLGRGTTFSVAGTRLSSMRDPSGGIHRYAYTSGYLTSYTHPLAGTTRYAYADTARNLTSVTLPDGSETRMTYDAQQRVTTITRITDPVAGTGEVTRYAYAPGVTTVTDPDGRERRFSYDGRSRVTNASDGAEPPALAVSGPLAEARGETLPPGETTLEFGASDARAGIAQFRIAVDGEETEELERDCTDGCPETTDGDWTMDTDDWEPGPHTVTVLTTDGTGSTTSQSFIVNVPAQPEDGDGTHPGDGVEPEPEGEISPEECEDYYEPGSIYCVEPPSTPPAVDPDARAAASRLASDHIYGISQDGALGFPLFPRFRELKVRRVRRILPYNLMERETPVPPATVGPRKFRDAIAGFRAFYESAIDNNLDIMVSFQFRIRKVTDSSGNYLTHCPWEPAPTDPDPRPIVIGYENSGPPRDPRADPSVRPRYDPAYDKDCDGFIPDTEGRDSNFNYLPAFGNYRDNLRSFKKQFPRVKTFSAWNEPNFKFQPTRAGRAGAKRAARFTFWLSKHICDQGRSCKVVAGDLAGGEGTKWRKYVATYAREVVRLFKAPGARGGPVPLDWAIHPYGDVMREYPDKDMRRTATSQFIDLVPASRRIWISESGSRVDTGGNRRHRRNSEESQRREVHYLLEKLAKSRNSIARIYYYSLCGPETFSDGLRTHDTGLLGLFPRLSSQPLGACYIPDEPGQDTRGQAKRMAYNVFKTYANLNEFG